MQRPARRSRIARPEASSSRVSRSHSVQSNVSDTAELPPSDISFFPNSRDFVVSNPTFYSIQGERNVVTLSMKQLHKRIISGAEHDSSLRDPPPQCHPGTRIELHAKINTWFREKERDKALLWLSGPAGVGKSAVMQTFAESLAESLHLGASLFFSRLNDRNDPQRVFTTIAFQLATRIPVYQTYITGQIALDPSLLNKGMKEQFRIFITEPFGNRGIGGGEGPWGVLLDGLDECDGVDEQCRIVQLVSRFVINFPDAPLVWSISSRPEPHITTIFKDEATSIPSYWSEYIPINSTAACRDVERYLNSSFEAMREYPYVPPNWPSETQFLKLANGALGLFIFAKTAVRFMSDPNYADPVSRLELLLSVIDHLDVELTDDNPFVLLDALYAQILTSIPLTLRDITKQILGFTICTQPGFPYRVSYRLISRNLMGTSVILGHKLGVVYSSLHKLHSVLEVPNPKDAYEHNVAFLHASFVDYLSEQTRSKEFFIDRGESVDGITRRLYMLHLDKPWNDGWAGYASLIPGPVGSNFSEELRQDAGSGLYYAVTGRLKRGHSKGRGLFESQQDLSECLNFLNGINTAELYWFGRFECEFTAFLFQLWDVYPELESQGLYKRMLLQDLRVDHLDCERNKPSYVSDVGLKKTPGSPLVLEAFVEELKTLQRRYRTKNVLVCGSTPEKRNAFFHFTIYEGGIPLREYYCIPYPY